MSVWLRLNKREAARKKGILCLSIIVCSLFLTHKKPPPYCYSTFLYMPSLSHLFFILPVGLSHGTCSLEFLFREAPWPSHSPFCSLFLFRTQAAQGYLLCSQAAQIKATLWWKSNHWWKISVCVLISLILDIKSREFQVKLAILFLFLKKNLEI